MVRDQLAWWIGGPVFGLIVVACRALFGGRLGVTGGFSEIVSKLGARSVAFDWRGWFAIGVLLGGSVYLAVHGGPLFHGFGWLTRHLDPGVVAAVLVAGGVLIGYGAKTAGGCTSGNGLSGTAMLSPASLVATATFFATAIVVNLLIGVFI
jgi:uncharacterized membrane protein YedE/YeeE